MKRTKLAKGILVALLVVVFTSFAAAQQCESRAILNCNSELSNSNFCQRVVGLGFEFTETATDGCIVDFYYDLSGISDCGQITVVKYDQQSGSTTVVSSTDPTSGVKRARINQNGYYFIAGQRECNPQCSAGGRAAMIDYPDPVVAGDDISFQFCLGDSVDIPPVTLIDAPGQFMCPRGEVVCGAQNAWDSNARADKLYCCPYEGPGVIDYDDFSIRNPNEGSFARCGASEVMCGARTSTESEDGLDQFLCCDLEGDTLNAPGDEVDSTLPGGAFGCQENQVACGFNDHVGYLDKMLCCDLTPGADGTPAGRVQKPQISPTLDTRETQVGPRPGTPRRVPYDMHANDHGNGAGFCDPVQTHETIRRAACGIHSRFGWQLGGNPEDELQCCQVTGMEFDESSFIPDHGAPLVTGPDAQCGSDQYVCGMQKAGSLQRDDITGVYCCNLPEGVETGTERTVSVPRRDNWIRTHWIHLQYYFSNPDLTCEQNEVMTGITINYESNGRFSGGITCAPFYQTYVVDITGFWGTEAIPTYSDDEAPYKYCPSGYFYEDKNEHNDLIGRDEDFWSSDDWSLESFGHAGTASMMCVRKEPIAVRSIVDDNEAPVVVDMAFVMDADANCPEDLEEIMGSAEEGHKICVERALIEQSTKIVTDVSYCTDTHYDGGGEHTYSNAEVDKWCQPCAALGYDSDEVLVEDFDGWGKHVACAKQVSNPIKWIEVCDTNQITQGMGLLGPGQSLCNGGYCSKYSLGSASCSADTTGVPPGQYPYYGYVCDASGCPSSNIFTAEYPGYRSGVDPIDNGTFTVCSPDQEDCAAAATRPVWPNCNAFWTQNDLQCLEELGYDSVSFSSLNQCQLEAADLGYDWQCCEDGGGLRFGNFFGTASDPTSNATSGFFCSMSGLGGTDTLGVCDEGQCVEPEVSGCAALFLNRRPEDSVCIQEDGSYKYATFASCEAAPLVGLPAQAPVTCCEDDGTLRWFSYISGAACGMELSGTCNAVGTCGGECLDTDSDGLCDPTCFDGLQNQDETGVDCGGVCPACPCTGSGCTNTSTCTNGIQDGDETGVDCGGSCPACSSPGHCNNTIFDGDETGVDCGGSCPPCGTNQTDCTDADGDGYGSGLDCLGPDCDDTDATIYANCTSGCITDLDGDGYGVGCSLGTDCDDNNSQVNPGAEELCNDGIDNDCDTFVDETACTPDNCTDVDGDGYGVGVACLGPDCDDNNATINPGATDICSDGIDQDCDGTDPTCPLQKYTWDTTQTGTCKEDPWCLVSPSGNANSTDPDDYFSSQKPKCIDTGSHILDHYCVNGNWTSRSKQLAKSLLTAAGSDYTLYCDEPLNVFNNIEDTDSAQVRKIKEYFADNCEINNRSVVCTNPVCVLNSNGQVIIGSTLNYGIKETNNFSMLSAFGFSNNYCSNIPGTSTAFQPCLSNFAWYNPSIRTLVMSDASISMITYNPSDTSMESEFSFASDARDFTTIAINKDGNKKIHGVFMDYQPGQKHLMVQYSGFSTDLCAYDAMQPHCSVNGTKTTYDNDDDSEIILKYLLKDLVLKLAIE